ncbi:MAG TPA: glycosyltransferase [Solirubrobacteraceae bacterium]|nr:glycosyltransferase [Solirubrobacteraceae bacterium]
MALRLTGISTPADGAGAPAGVALTPAASITTSGITQSGAGFGNQFGHQARAYLTTNDLTSYKALFQRAAEHEDSHARYHANVRLVEEGLTAAGQAASSTQATQRFAAVAAGAIDALEAEPREPVLLNYAGVALYELWSLDAAHAIFKAAHDLDPALPHLKRNLNELGRRRREASQSGRSLKPLHATVPALAAKAKAIAKQAKPAARLKLSLCMIVKDEEEMLPRCLAAVAPAVDEIVIVDTGSTDRTIEIARDHNATVIEKPWTGSFSDARNASFEAATGDWIIYLDADEVLVADDVQRLKALTGRTWREAFYVVETSYTGELGDGAAMTNNALRIFRNRPNYRFEGRLHEQIAQNLPLYAAGRVEQSSVRVEHYGYLGAVRDAKEKSRRNLDLLKAQQAESPSDAFLHFNLGTEYAVIGDYASALIELDRAWSLVKSQGQEDRDYVPVLLHRLVTALRRCGRPQEAIARAEEALAKFPDFTDMVFDLALAALALNRVDDAIGYWQRCIEMGDAPARFGGSLGAGTYLPRISLAEVHARRGELDRARELLDWCITERPNVVGVIAPYATTLLRSGTSADEVAEKVASSVPELTPSARHVLATTFFSHGDMPAAENQFRAVLEARPNSAEVRVQLAETLLNQNKHAEAAAQATQIAEDDSFAGLACRIELWSLIASGNTDEAGAATARATRAGVPAAEIEVFTGWAEISTATADAQPRKLPAAGVPLLGVILETLLSAHDFDTFEKLTKLLSSSAMPEREQRELLGSMYLKHGFLQSAAMEWMAVCETNPDTRALVGLARVARANGQLEDATVFATEALKQDPTSAGAREILAAA